MGNVEIIINGNNVPVKGIYYVNRNNYYFIYTNLDKDENGLIIFHIVKVMQEVVNTNNGPQATGYLIGTTIVNDDEYNLVKEDIAKILDEKQNQTQSSIVYVDLEMLKNLKIRDTKIFRLKEAIFERVFGTAEVTQSNLNSVKNDVSNSNDINSIINENKQLKEQINLLNKKIDDIKNILK